MLSILSSENGNDICSSVIEAVPGAGNEGVAVFHIDVDVYKW